MSKFEHLIPENCALPGAEFIGIYDSNGVKAGEIKIPQRMKYPTGNKLYSFCALSDVHITYNTANADFQRALTYVENSDCAFTCICGDLTSNGSDSQLTAYKSIVDTYAPTKPVYAIAGNHETLLGNDMTFNRTTPYTGHPLYYSFEQGNDVFIMIGHYGGYKDGNGGWVKGTQFSDEELQWLYETLEANRNKRCFVFNHSFPWSDGVGNVNGIYDVNLWTSTKGTVFENLMKHYKNTVLFHGHSHIKFSMQALDKRLNYSSHAGYRSVHIPSISVPRDITNNSFSYAYADSEGYIVDVFENEIVLRGRDFIDNQSNGNWIPIGTFKLDTTLQTVEAGTFTDGTGTVETST